MTQLASSSLNLNDLLLVVGVVVADELAAEHQPAVEPVEGLVAVGDLGDGDRAPPC
jgi:hypothetical protein